MKFLAFSAVVFLAGLAASANPRTFKGQITDSECAYNVHSVTRSHEEMAGIKGGLTDKQCTIYCVEQGDSIYVFLGRDGKTVYKLSTEQKDLKQYAGDKVEVEGELEPKEKVIRVSKIKRISAASH